MFQRATNQGTQEVAPGSGPGCARWALAPHTLTVPLMSFLLTDLLTHWVPSFDTLTPPFWHFA